MYTIHKQIQECDDLEFRIFLRALSRWADETGIIIQLVVKYLMRLDKEDFPEYVGEMSTELREELLLALKARQESYPIFPPPSDFYVEVKDKKE
jgi:hypothetical protein